MLTKITGIMGAIALGSAFTYIGYFLYIGDPLEAGTRKGRAFMQVQNWLIENLGMSNSGLLLMAVGVVGGGLALRAALLDSDDE